MRTDTLGVYPVDEMIEKSGKILTISRVLEKDRDEYWVEEMGFTWTNEMFEEAPVPDCTTYINTSSDSCNPHWQPLTWQPLTVDDFGKISSITMTVDDIRKEIVQTTNEELKIRLEKLEQRLRLEELEQKIRKEKENKKMNCKDLINIYFVRMERRILEEKRNKDKEIKENDEIQKLLEDTENQINVMLDRDEERRFCLPTIYTYTDETDKALIDNEIETDRKIEELHQLKEEVDAQLSIIPEDKYEVAVEVLKNYEILDKKGKINA